MNKEDVIASTLQDLVDHNREMVKFCTEGDHGAELEHYYEGKLDAYTRALELVQDMQRLIQ